MLKDILVCLGIVVISIFNISGCISAEPPLEQTTAMYTARTISNMRNLGLVMQDENLNTVICRDENGQYNAYLDSTMVANNVDCCFLIDNGWLYYSNAGDQGKLYRVNLESRKKDIVCDFICDEVIVFNGQLYCTPLTEDGLYRMQLDGTSIAKILDGNVYSIYSYNDSIYYCYEQSIFQYKENGSQEQVETDLSVKEFYIVDDQLIYLTSLGAIYLTPLSGGQNIHTLLYQGTSPGIAIFNNSLVVTAFGKSYYPETFILEFKNGEKKVIQHHCYACIFTTTTGIYASNSSDTPYIIT